MKKQLILLLSAAGFLAACGGGQQPASTESSSTEQSATATAPAASEFTINAVGNTMDDMSYDTKEIRVKAGSMVKINLVNKATESAMIHNIVIVKPGTEKDVAMEGLNFAAKNYCNMDNANIIAGSPLAEPGKTVTLEFKAPEAGTYSYICTFPGHWMKMQGKLIVE